MALCAGTLVGKGTAFAVQDRQTFTIQENEPAHGFVTLAFWDQSKDDEHNVMVIPREQFARAIEAYLGV